MKRKRNSFAVIPLAFALVGAACGSDAPSPGGAAGAGDAGNGGDAASSAPEGGAPLDAGGMGDGADSADGTVDSDSPDGAAGPVLPDYVLAAVQAVSRGGSADLDGDGVPDLVTTVDATSSTTKVMVGDAVLLVVVRRADGTADKQGDLNLDGSFDYTEHEVDTGDTFTRTTEQDEDFDGVVDWTETFVIDATAGTTHTTQQALVAGVWTPQADWTNSLGYVLQAAPLPCSLTYPGPAGAISGDVPVFGQVRVVQCKATGAGGSCLGGDGSCSPSEVVRIESALATLFQDALDALKPLSQIDVADTNVVQCLKRRQPAFLEALIHNLAQGGVEPGTVGTAQANAIFSGARIACGIACGSGGTLSGSTESVRRERVSVNMDQDDGALRDTLLHELIHASGYDGASDHNDENGAHDDSIYACSAWCTGRSVKSTSADGTLQFDPNGTLDMHDCFRCSGTYAAKKECCGTENVCQGGCCPGACAPNGGCAADPCDPRTNGGDFSHCKYTGTGTSTVAASADGGAAGSPTSSTATVTWTFDHVDGMNVTLVPSGSIAASWTLPQCTVSPLSGTIAAADGSLVLAYGSDPLQYSGHGATYWPVTLTCGPATQGSTFSSGWFFTPMGATYPFTPGQPLANSWTSGDVTGTWNWQLAVSP
jgi:hypothetical protein